MKILFVALLVLLSFSNSFSQANLIEKEQEIKLDFDRLIQADTDSLKLSICNTIQKVFQEILIKEQSFNYPFAQLTKMGKLSSSDQVFRIYNWNCVLSDGSYRYYGLIQHKQKKSIFVEVLEDSGVAPDMMKQYTVADWTGALYYQIVPFKMKGKSNYLLLGWDGNNFNTNKKIIEVLCFSKDGKAKFGMPVILWKGKTLNRVVFEYAKQAGMSIQYNEKRKQIVFDHLAPSLPIYQNQFEYYGPDFSYDALEYREGKWELVENIDVRNRRENK